jgi:hypothetical protein
MAGFVIAATADRAGICVPCITSCRRLCGNVIDHVVPAPGNVEARSAPYAFGAETKMNRSVPAHYVGAYNRIVLMRGDGGPSGSGIIWSDVSAGIARSERNRERGSPG